MYLKQKLIKASSICLYVSAALWIIAAGCAFGLSNYIYWLFLVFGLVSLYDGFALSSLAGKLEGVKFSKKQNIQFIICWALSLVCLPAFIINIVAYCRRREDELVVRRNVEVEQPQPAKKKAF